MIQLKLLIRNIKNKKDIRFMKTCMEMEMEIRTVIRTMIYSFNSDSNQYFLNLYLYK